MSPTSLSTTSTSSPIVNNTCRRSKQHSSNLPLLSTAAFRSDNSIFFKAILPVNLSQNPMHLLTLSASFWSYVGIYVDSPRSSTTSRWQKWIHLSPEFFLLSGVPHESHSSVSPACFPSTICFIKYVNVVEKSNNIWEDICAYAMRLATHIFCSPTSLAHCRSSGHDSPLKSGESV